MRLVFHPNAESDLEHIGDFIAEDNPDAAVAFVRRLRERCRQIGQFPGIGRRRSDLTSGYRSLSEGQYVILYVVLSEQVEIARILHSKQDLGKTLKE